MNILAFFSTVDSLELYCRYLKVQGDTETKVTFISVKPVKEEDLCVLQSLGASCIINESLSIALTKAAEFVNDIQDTVITTVDVIPVDNFIELIKEAKSKIPDLSACFGRWYNATVADRADTTILGFKYKDAAPKLFAHHVVEYSPYPNIHAIKVSRFPVFLNYFDKEVSTTLKHALCSAVSFSEFSFFFSEFLKNYDDNKGIYYVPSIEVVDKKLL